jgi:predicted methyltransferase
MADATSKELYQRLPKLNPAQREAMEELVVTAVDGAIARMLNYFDEEEVEVIVRRPSDAIGHDIRKLSDGLAGELYTEKGWIAKYSNFTNRLRPKQ